MVTGTTSVAQPAPVSAAANLATGDRAVESATPTRRASDNRRSNKPIMEKRRRARINNCLNELKTLILDAMKKDPARHSKLEKADILEMTVKHLENLQRQQAAMSAAADPAVVNKFRAGFSECAGEVGRFPGLEPAVKRRLLQHLAQCLATAGTGTMTTAVATPITVQPRQEHQAAVQVHILPTSSDTHSSIVQLVPTRLPNGDIALVLPAAPDVPTLVPIPSRTASTASASSVASSSSSAPCSPEPQHQQPLRPYSPPEQRPLSLVMRKTYEPAEEDKPWRPW